MEIAWKKILKTFFRRTLASVSLASGESVLGLESSTPPLIATKLVWRFSAIACASKKWSTGTRLVTRSSLERVVRISYLGLVKSDTGLPTTRHDCNISSKGAFLPSAMTQRWAPQTRYKLGRNTGSIIKDLIGTKLISSNQSNVLLLSYLYKSYLQKIFILQNKAVKKVTLTKWNFSAKPLYTILKVLQLN